MEVKKVEKQRNYSLDLLRVIAILMIIIFHVCYKALIFNNLSEFNKLIVAFFLHFGEIGVNLFMLITGFFLYKSNSSKTTKIIRLIYDIWFYFILNIILCAIVKGGYGVTLSTFFPISLGYFWYVTCYICILIFSPYLNLLTKNLEQKDYRRLLIISLIILSVIPTISGLAVASVENGPVYSRFIWLIFMYFLGAYISKYQESDRLLKNDREFFIKLNIFSSFLAIIFIFIFKYLSFSFMPKVPMFYMWPPNSIVVFLMSVSLFIIFVKTNLTKKTKVIKFIEKISQHTLGIYLLHDAPYNYLILADCFIWFQGFSTSKNLVFLIALITIFVFAVSLIVSIIKKFTTDRLYQVIFDKIEQKLKKSLNSSHL